MSNFFLSLFALLFAAHVFGQGKDESSYCRKFSDTRGIASPASITSLTKILPIWQNDFSVPADWTVSNVGSTPENPHTLGDWMITSDLNRIPEPSLNPAKHTTAANGYALVDSDGAGQFETQNTTISTTNAINLSGHNQVSIVFEQSHRRYREHTFVVVSNDNGATWTEFEVNAGMYPNSNTTNPAVVQVNISSVAANHSQVKIGFKYIGSYDFFWAVDDVKLIEPDAYDLQSLGLYWGTEGTRGIMMPYYKIPVTQLAPVKVFGIVKNNGGHSQTNVRFEAYVPTTSFSEISVYTNLEPDETDTLQTADYLPREIYGNFTLVGTALSGSQDAKQSNNTVPPIPFEITHGRYARDNNVIETGWNDNGNKFEAGNIFDIFQSTSLPAVDVRVHPASYPGVTIFAKLYACIGTGFELKAASRIYVLQSSDLNKVVTLFFDDPYWMNPDTSYLVTVGSMGGPGEDLLIAAGGLSAPRTSYYLDGQGWSYITATPMVRMNLTDFLSVKELGETTQFQVFPNPATNQVTVSLELPDASAITITVTDLTGKKVLMQAEPVAAGKQEIVLNTSALAEGIYAVNVTTTTFSTSSKLIISR